MITVLGIDPGLDGGWVFMPADVEDRPIWGDSGMLPHNGKEVDPAWFQSNLPRPSVVILERQHGRPQDGTASLNVTLPNYGLLRGFFLGIGWPFLIVTPQAWKKVVLKGTRRDKAAAIAHVKMLYPWVDLQPGQKRTDKDGIADAGCIAEWGLRELTRQGAIS